MDKSILKYELSFQDKSQIKYEILAYLSENPDAQDSLDGIIRWWLLERTIKYQSILIKEALADLVEQGLLLERKRLGIEPRYGINHNRINDIQEILKQCLMDKNK